MKIGLFGLLTLIFVTLKLTGYIDWAWWLVLSPSIFAIIAWTILFVLVIWTSSNPYKRYRK